MRRLLSYMKKYRTATVLAVFCIVLETFLELIIPLIMADMVDVGIANADKAYIFEKGLLMAGCAVVSMAVSYTHLRKNGTGGRRPTGSKNNPSEALPPFKKAAFAQVFCETILR